MKQVYSNRRIKQAKKKKKIKRTETKWNKISVDDIAYSLMTRIE